MSVLGWIGVGIAILVVVLFLPPVLAALPRTRGGGGLGPALSELNAAFNPAERQVEIARRQLPAERENAEPKDD